MSVRRALGVLVLLGLLPSWLGSLGSAHWLLDLFSHFRWQYLLFTVVAVAWCLHAGQRRIAALAAITLVFNAVLIGRLALAEEGEVPVAAGDFQLRVLSINVLGSNMDTQAVLDHVLETDADIVFLMEVDQRWVDALAALDARYPNRFKHPRADYFGLALYSRVPVTRTELMSLEQGAMPSVAAHMHYHGQRFTLIGTHPLPPVGGRAAASRDRQLASLASYVAGSSEPVLMMGDFNASPWSAVMRQLTAGKLAFSAHSPPWKPTWQVLSPFAIPIDHALSTAPLVITEANVGPDLGSDHRPMHYVVGWSDPVPSRQHSADAGRPSGAPRT